MHLSRLYRYSSYFGQESRCQPNWRNYLSAIFLLTSLLTVQAQDYCEKVKQGHILAMGINYNLDELQMLTSSGDLFRLPYKSSISKHSAGSSSSSDTSSNSTNPTEPPATASTEADLNPFRNPVSASAKLSDVIPKFPHINWRSVNESSAAFDSAYYFKFAIKEPPKWNFAKESWWTQLTNQSKSYFFIIWCGESHSFLSALEYPLKAQLRRFWKVQLNTKASNISMSVDKVEDNVQPPSSHYFIMSVPVKNEAYYYELAKTADGGERFERSGKFVLGGSKLPEPTDIFPLGVQGEPSMAISFRVPQAVSGEPSETALHALWAYENGTVALFREKEKSITWELVYKTTLDQVIQCKPPTSLLPGLSLKPSALAGNQTLPLHGLGVDSLVYDVMGIPKRGIGARGELGVMSGKIGISGGGSGSYISMFILVINKYYQSDPGLLAFVILLLCLSFTLFWFGLCMLCERRLERRKQVNQQRGKINIQQLLLKLKQAEQSAKSASTGGESSDNSGKSVPTSQAGKSCSASAQPNTSSLASKGPNSKPTSKSANYTG